MIRRIERPGTLPLRKLGVAKRAQGLVPFVEDRNAPELALRYSNGFVTVEISYDAVDAFVDEFGDVPLPVYVDPQTGDRRTFDAKTRVRVIYDRGARLREVTTRGRDGVYVRLTVLPDRAGPQGGAGEAFDDLAADERYEADDESLAQVVEVDVQPQDPGDENDRGAGEDGDEAPWIPFARPSFVE